MFAKVFILFLLCFQFAYAEVVEGRVVAVIDGDTVTVLDSSNKQFRVRLSGIDAPEKAQSFGVKSKQSLSELVFNKSVSVQYGKSDRYGRTLGKIIVNQVDINLEQVKRGFAWHYSQYAKTQSEEDRLLYSKAQNEASQAGRGLWTDPHPVAPWDFRRTKGWMSVG